MQRQASSARCSWQVTYPEAAGATTRARAEMHIAKGLPAHRSLGGWQRRTQKVDAMPTLLPCSCIVRSARRHARGAPIWRLGNSVKLPSRSPAFWDDRCNAGRVVCNDRVGRESQQLPKSKLIDVEGMAEVIAQYVYEHRINVAAILRGSIRCEGVHRGSGASPALGDEPALDC